MNNHCRWGVVLLLLGTIGCGTSETPQGSADTQQADRSDQKLTKATLHIIGFMKSKSGAI